MTTIGRTQSGKMIPTIGSPVYTEKVKERGWNILVTPLQVPKLLNRRLRDWTKQDHLDAAAHHHACEASHNEKLKKLIDHGNSTFGAGKLLTCGFYEHWPEDFKEKCRFHCHKATEHGACAYAHEMVRVRKLKPNQ